MTINKKQPKILIKVCDERTYELTYINTQPTSQK